MSVINTNVKSLVARDSMTINNRALSTAMERLSTGKRINSGADDAAGLSIGTRMDAQVKGLNMAIKNANDAISVTQTAEGAMQEVTSILQRMRELSVQSANDTNSAEDRAFLQQEVTQLSSEIDRISSTTQFNGINVLDGTFKGKVFQIGANQGQTMGLSIGSMKSSVLGVASGNTAVSNTSASAPAVISDASAQGVKATATVVKLGFTNSDEYSFKVADDVSGLDAAGVDKATTGKLDLTSDVSKRDFVNALNKSFKEAALNTTLTGSATVAAATDITKPENYADLKFSVSINGGTPVNSIDLRSRLLSTAGPAGHPTAVTDLELASAIQSELQGLYDDSITVAISGNKMAITDKQGRKIEVSQGAGSGAIFGTDVVNVGALKVDANVQTNLSAAWNGNDLMVTNKAGGKTTVSGYATTGTSSVVFDAVTDAQANQRDPIKLIAAKASDDAVTYKGSVEKSSLQMTFSDRLGDGTKNASAIYNFKLTNGAGDVYADLSKGLDLKIDPSNTDADIVSAVKAKITAGITDLVKSGDTSFNADEFEVGFKNNVLTITNTAGRALAIEEFSSTAGTVNVNPTNEPGAVKTLASQSALYSSLKLDVNTANLGATVDLTGATDAGKFYLYVDGVKSTAALELTVDGTDNATGAALATALQTLIQDNTKAEIKNPTTNLIEDLSKVTVNYDASTGSLSIRDSRGRAIGLVAADTNTLAGQGAIFLNDGGTAAANKGHAVVATSDVAQGDVYNTTKVTMGLSQDSTKGLNFKVNGVALGATDWDASQPFEGSTMKKNLDAMMVSLNSHHPKDVFEYSVSGRNITFLQRDGGAVKVSDFATGTGYDAVTATLTPAAGQGSTQVIGQNEAVVTANASGTRATASTATLKLTGDDLYSLSVSDGKNTYTMAPTTVDLLDANSTRKFVDTLNGALGGSSIKASMDTKGNLFLTDETGGPVALTSFTSATGKVATWTPKQGQGNTLTLSGTGAIPFCGDAPAGVPQVVTPAAGSSVSQISIATQEGASKALKVIDSALSYVNNERSKLGAVENRLTHTIDNLTNVVTNTAASKSRIVDTDYATETTELARTQIIQQAATAMLAQANQSAQGVLSLLK